MSLWLLFVALWPVVAGCARPGPAARQPEPSPTLTAVPTVPPGPTPGSPVMLTPGNVVEVAVYADTPVRAEPKCLELVPLMVPASAIGKLPSRAQTCRVGPEEGFNYRFIRGADGLFYLYRASIIALTTRLLTDSEVPDCSEIRDYLLPVSADPAVAVSGKVCWVEPLPMGHGHREVIEIWVKLPVNARDIRFPPDIHCWELTAYMGLPRGVDTFPVACILN